MKRSLMTKILAALIASVLVLTGLPAISTVRAAEAPEGATVSVGTSRVTVTINKVGTSGTASLFRMAANEYYSGDNLNGYSTLTNRTGTFIGSYVCGSSKEFTFNRFNSDGTDNLYAKYYLVQGNDILVGPFYASEVESYRSIPRFEAVTKKGLTHENNETYPLADEMGISNTVVNLDLGSLI